MTRWKPLCQLLAAAVLVAACQGARAQPPASSGDALPATQTNGDLKLTFTGLKLVPPPDGADQNDPNEARWSRLSFKFDWGGRPMREWAVQKVTVTNAEGETYSPKRLSTYFGKGEGNLAFPGPTWPTTRPWKLRLELARTSAIQSYEFWTAYNPDEILTIKALRVPAAGKVNAIEKTVEAQGAKFHLVGLASGNTPMPGAMPVKYPYPTLHWRVERPENVYVTFLRVTDPAGHVIPLRAAAHGWGNGGEQFARELQVPAGVGEIYVAFGVHKSRVFEVTAAPTVDP